MPAMKDLDLDLPATPSRRPWRHAIMATLLLGAGLVAFEASEAAQETIILPPSPVVVDSEILPPVAGEFTSSITPSSPRVIAGAARAEDASAMSLGERKVTIALLLICFGVMAIGSVSLWRRGFRDMTETKRR
ncbi:hypothetical protein IP76_07920 [Rhizobium sp. AAP43]|nr:hypothetical protein IP76_07920 [Rhizobium sp. AAP43]